MCGHYEYRWSDRLAGKEARAQLLNAFNVRIQNALDKSRCAAVNEMVSQSGAASCEPNVTTISKYGADREIPAAIHDGGVHRFNFRRWTDKTRSGVNLAAPRQEAQRHHANKTAVPLSPDKNKVLMHTTRTDNNSPRLTNSTCTAIIIILFLFFQPPDGR